MPRSPSRIARSAQPFRRGRFLKSIAAFGPGGRGGDQFTSVSKLDLVSEVRRLLQENQPDLYRHIGQEVDRVVLQELMNFVSGNQLQAAERLGISRMTLRSKLRSRGMIQERQTDQDDAS